MKVVKWLFALLYLMSAASLQAVFNDEPVCFKQLQTDFFREDLVLEALSMGNVFQSQWNPIVTKLRQRAHEIPRIFAEHASRMERDPRDYPFQAEVAWPLLRQLLFDLFSAVLVESNVTQEYNLREMFGYIVRQQADRLNRCFMLTDQQRIPYQQQ